jgi:RNA polymerase sigma-70 factor (ECF subfamily)
MIDPTIPQTPSDTRLSSDPGREVLQQITIEFSDFYRSELTALVTFLLWTGANAHDALDVAQDAMLEAYRRWQVIRDPRAWIRTVASRKYGRRLGSVEEPTDSIEASTLQRPDIDIEAWEQQQEVLRLLSGLPLRQRQIMAWFYDGYEHADIARELNLTPENVRSNLKKARRALGRHQHPGGGGDQ